MLLLNHFSAPVDISLHLPRSIALAHGYRMFSGQSGEPMCLLFDTTKPLFHNWVKYGIATLFAMAVLDFTTSIVMKLMLRVAAATWSSNVIGALTGETAEGLSNTAMQQGGIGLILTLLIISAPPMAAQFFGGTLGQFQPFSQLGVAAQPGAQGPAGQAPGSWGGAGSPASATADKATVPGNQGYGRPIAQSSASDTVRSHQGEQGART